MLREIDRNILMIDETIVERKTSINGLADHLVYDIHNEGLLKEKYKYLYVYHSLLLFTIYFHRNSHYLDFFTINNVEYAIFMWHH